MLDGSGLGRAGPQGRLANDPALDESNHGLDEGAIATPISTPTESVTISYKSASRLTNGTNCPSSLEVPIAKPPRTTAQIVRRDGATRSQRIAKTTKIPQWTILSRFGTSNHEESSSISWTYWLGSQTESEDHDRPEDSGGNANRLQMIAPGGRLLCSHTGLGTVADSTHNLISPGCMQKPDRRTASLQSRGGSRRGEPGRAAVHAWSEICYLGL